MSGYLFTLAYEDGGSGSASDPGKLQKARSTLRQYGISEIGAKQFLEGMPVISSLDRMKLARLSVEILGSATILGSPAIVAHAD